MLQKPERLRRMRDFALLSQKGRVVYSPFFTLRFRSTPEATRVGFVASTKLFKTAVARNRVKRRLREALRMLRPEWPKNLDLLFIAKPEVLGADFVELQQAIQKTFLKIPEAMTQPIRPRTPRARRKTSVVYKASNT